MPGSDLTSFPNKFVPAITVSLSFNCIAPSGPIKVRLPYPEPPGAGATISSARAKAVIPAPIRPATRAIPIRPAPLAILNDPPTTLLIASFLSSLTCFLVSVKPKALATLDANIIPFIAT